MRSRIVGLDLPIPGQSASRTRHTPVSGNSDIAKSGVLKRFMEEISGSFR
jgi:hypothetical protein